MWIGVALLVMVDGSMEMGSKFFSDEASCRAKNAEIMVEVRSAPQVLAWSLECYQSEKFLTIRKPDPAVKPKASKEPGPETNGA